jgi:hypothetical protein
MKNIEDSIRELADKWRYAHMESSNICRDAAEELRVMKIQLQAANRELEIYREMNKSKFIPNNVNLPVGWGKGKDE